MIIKMFIKLRKTQLIEETTKIGLRQTGKFVEQ